MPPIKILKREIAAKTVSAVWFGMSAALLVLLLPTAQLIFLNSTPSMDGLKQPDRFVAPTMFVLHFVIPVVAGTVIGGRLGDVILTAVPPMSAKGAFERSVKITIYSAIAWALGGFVWLVIMSMFTDVSRMYGGVIVLLFFGLPVYPLLGGVSGLLLKRIAGRGR